MKAIIFLMLLIAFTIIVILEFYRFAMCVFTAYAPMSNDEVLREMSIPTLLLMIDVVGWVLYFRLL